MMGFGRKMQYTISYFTSSFVLNVFCNIIFFELSLAIENDPIVHEYIRLSLHDFCCAVQRL